MQVETPPDGSGGTSQGADGVGPDGGKGDKVDHATYLKVMGELKSTKSELKKFQDSQKEIENKKQLEEKNFLGVIEQLRTENETLKHENDGHKSDKKAFRVMNAVLGVLNAKGVQLEDKYYGLLPLDQIIVDEEGRPDKTSVAKVAADFVKDHPRLIAAPGKPLPSDSSSNGLQKISVDEWKKLPADDKIKALKEKRVQHDFDF